MDVIKLILFAIFILAIAIACGIGFWYWIHIWIIGTFEIRCAIVVFHVCLALKIFVFGDHKFI